MNTPSLVDLSPLWLLLLVGALLAAVGMAWAWLRSAARTRSDWLRALTLLTLFLTFDLVLFGAYTRLSDSGLGCPDWPGCYGSASPLGAHSAIHAAQTALPSGPVTHGKAWVEMVHRYMATGVGGLILVLAIASWRRAASTGGGKGLRPWWPTLTLAWVCVQGAFGAWTVTMKLFPAIVTLHLLGGLLLLALLCVQAQGLVRLQRGGLRVAMDLATRAVLLVACGVLVAQVALGGWVSTNYAVLACSDFPLCQQRWWPAMRFDQGFQIWRELGMLQDGSHISFAGLTAIHFVHRAMAVVVLAALGLLAWRLNRQLVWRKNARWIAGLALLQVATGLGNVLLGWPLAAALMHTGGAAALVMALTWTLAASSSGTWVAGAAAASAASPRHPSTLLGAVGQRHGGLR